MNEEANPGNDVVRSFESKEERLANREGLERSTTGPPEVDLVEVGSAGKKAVPFEVSVSYPGSHSRGRSAVLSPHGPHRSLQFDFRSPARARALDGFLRLPRLRIPKLDHNVQGMAEPISIAHDALIAVAG
jgi:hypothetical protein